jgi:hypothetical protein
MRISSILKIFPARKNRIMNSIPERLVMIKAPLKVME